jgi:hypothetical protein
MLQQMWFDRSIVGVSSLTNRIGAEFFAAEDRVKQFQSQRVQELQSRQQCLEQFARLAEKLRETWRPRLSAPTLKTLVRAIGIGDQCIPPKIAETTSKTLETAYR